MSSTLSATQSGLSAGEWAAKPSVDATLRPVDLSNYKFPNRRPSLSKQTPHNLARLLITFFIGVAATWAWQSYGDAGRKMIASSSPRLGWLAPQAAPLAQTALDMIAPAAPSPDLQPQLEAMSLGLAAVRESIDQLAASHEQMMRSVNQLAAELAAGRD